MAYTHMHIDAYVHACVRTYTYTHVILYCITVRGGNEAIRFGENPINLRACINVQSFSSTTTTTTAPGASL